MKLTSMLLIIILSACTEKEDKDKSTQRISRLDKPGERLDIVSQNTPADMKSFMNNFTSVSQPLIIPLPKTDKDKFDIANELVKLDSGTDSLFLNFDTIKDPFNIYPDRESGLFYYYKIEVKDNVTFPIVFFDSGYKKYFVMYSIGKDYKLHDALVIAGKSDLFSFKADIENSEIIITGVERKIRYTLSEDGKFIMK